MKICSDVCNSLQGWVETLGLLSSDKEHVTVSFDDKVHIINKAVSMVASARPDMFTETIDFTLSPGQYQTLPESVISVVGSPVVVKSNGMTGVAAKQVGEEVISAFATFNKYRNCQSASSNVSSEEKAETLSDKWVMQSYAYDPRNPTQMIVSPDVPEGTQPKIKLTIQSQPPCYSVNDVCAKLPTKYQGELLERIMYLYFNIPSESESALRRMELHATQYYSLLGFNYKYQKAFASGRWMGQDEKAKVQ